MVSSTFTDLEEHRAELIKIIDRRGLMAIPMEYDAALPAGDVIDSSLGKVRDGSAYVGIIAKRYGQIPPDPKRNSRKVSITELEFDEAVRLKRPMLLFIMGEKHLLLESQIEPKAANKKKLNAFRRRAKEMGPDNRVHRVYATFQNLEDFKEKAAQSVDALRRHLDALDEVTASPKGKLPQDSPAEKPLAVNSIPRPPSFYAQPPYIGSHQFVGRRDQLDTLDEWALPADSHPLLLYEAIGGSGKSMLTWEWVRNRAPAVRKNTQEDWAGRFWYSFYERGAIMADFCRHALAYMTGQPLAELNKQKTGQLAPQLLHQLQARPWLLVLDGLERVLVAYNRIDAAQLRDEEAGKTDAIAQRDPCAAIRPEDDDLLRLLATTAPSKLLVTSRLIPRVLLNNASQPIPGVLRERLPGLRPADAEALFRACGVKGDAAAIQTYLKTHCDCHPLTVGALAGLVINYLPARANFDQWSSAADGGGILNLADLNLVQKQNHILETSIAALPEGSRRLLSIIALLSEAVDYETLKAINPHLPPAVEEVPVPDNPETRWDWEYISDDERAQAKQDYPEALKRRAEYEQAAQARLQTPEYRAAPQRLADAIADLEKRGLLQYNAQAQHYDMHPVVRGIAAGGLAPAEKEALGQRVVDHFSARPHNPYEQAETLEDVRDGLHVVRTLAQMGRLQQAYEAYRGDLSDALLFNLEANAETVALLRPFFPGDWAALPLQSFKRQFAYLANNAGIALDNLGQHMEALASYGNALLSHLDLRDWSAIRVSLGNLGNYWKGRNRLSKTNLCNYLSMEVASLIDDQEELFLARFNQYSMLAEMGQWPEAEDLWRSLDAMGWDWSRAAYRPGEAESSYAFARFKQGKMQEEDLAQAERLARDGRSRQSIRNLQALRGTWRLEQGEWQLAAESLQEAVAMAQAVGQRDAWSETLLALAKLHLGQLVEPRASAELLAKSSDVSHLALATFWVAIGDQDQAKHHALAAYQLAWGDGEPYVDRYRLNKSRSLLEQMGVEIPSLPPYDPAKDEKLPWEDAMRAAIEELRAEKAEEAAKQVAEKKSD